MTAQKKKTTPPKYAADSLPASSPRHRIDALLHTMRCIAQHEDALCELSHSIRSSSSLSRAASKELRTILDKLPSHDYLHDLEAVEALVHQPSPSPAGSTE